MSKTAVQTYVEGIDPAAERVVLALDRAVRGANPSFDVAIKYRILMYSVNADWGTWVCSIDATKKRVSLRFLFGVLLDDPKHVLRKGSSVLMSWDFGFDESIDDKAVRAYVKEAVAKKQQYVDNRVEVLAAARAKH